MAVRLGAMVDYFSAAFWLAPLRTPGGLEAWVERCAALGLGRLYFRVLVYGDFVHHTRLERRDMEQTCAAFADFDVLALVTAAAHARGVEVVPWVTLCDEGVPGHRYTRFAEAHPELLMRDRDGRVYDRALSYGHAPARAYRVGLVRELMGYGVDGVLLDFTRWLSRGHMQAPGVALTDSGGISLFGYDEPVVLAWRTLTGTDPLALPNGHVDWVRFRAAATHTALLRDLRTDLPGFPLYAYVPARGFLAELLLDVPAWVRDGLVDQLCVSCVTDVPEEGRAGRFLYATSNDYARQFRQLVARHEGRCRVGAPVLISASFGPHPDFVGLEPWSFQRPEVLEETMRSAALGGADEVIFYDLCQEYNGEDALWEALGPVCRRVRGLPVPGEPV